MRACLILLILVTVAPLADAQVTVVHPNQYATSEGYTNNSWPFRYTNIAGHYQQSHDATQFPGPMTITEIAFRYKGDTPVATGTADFKMRFSYCATAWNALSGTFATNVGTGSTVVFDGKWAIPAFSGDPATPNPFTAKLVLTTPFPYDPASGDLLIDIEMRTSTYSSSAGAFARCDASLFPGVYRVYANTGNPTEPTGTVGNNGLIAEFTGLTQVIPYGKGCAGLGGFIPVLSMTGTPSGGQQVNLSLDKGLGGAMSATLISIGSANVSLGGGCTLLITSTPFSFLIPLGGSAGVAGAGSYLLSALIPVGTPAGTIYLQSFVNDPAGPISLSVSNGLKVEIK